MAVTYLEICSCRSNDPRSWHQCKRCGPGIRAGEKLVKLSAADLRVGDVFQAFDSGGFGTAVVDRIEGLNVHVVRPYLLDGAKRPGLERYTLGVSSSMCYRVWSRRGTP